MSLDAYEHERLTPQDVTKRFCQLATKVATEHFNNIEASDCFCERSDDPNSLGHRALFATMGMGDFRFSERVLAFIEAAVDEHLAQEQGR